MRFSQIAFAQHLGWTFKKHWQVQGRRVPRETGASAELLKYGANIKHPSDVIQMRQQFNKYEAVQSENKHILQNAKSCYIFTNSNVPLEGVTQAQNLSKTVLVSNFRQSMEKDIGIHFSPQVERKYENIISSSLVLDAAQEKLSKVRLEKRPNFNLPRIYGIPPKRATRLLVKNLLNECEKTIEYKRRSSKNVFEDYNVKSVVARNEDLINFDFSYDFFIFSSHPIEPIKKQYDESIPDMHPLKYSIAMGKTNSYSSETFFPKIRSSNLHHPHTIISIFNNENVNNLHQSPVTNCQMEGRAILLSFAATVAEAKKLYGENFHENLPSPIVVQTIMTDGCKFYFGAFQLNSLCLNDDVGLKNYWFKMPAMDLFTFCGYKKGRLYLEGVNMDVIKYFNFLYNNM